MISDFSEPKVAYGAIKSTSTKLPQDDANEIFECPESGCCATFSSLRYHKNHQSVGKHFTSSLLTYDKVRKRWASTCNVNLQQIVRIPNISKTSDQIPEELFRKERMSIKKNKEIYKASTSR